MEMTFIILKQQNYQSIQFRNNFLW